MQKTIFSRYIRITMSIVIVGFVLLGLITMVFFSQFWRSEKQAMLSQNTEAIVKATERTLSFQSSYNVEFPREIIETFLNNFSTSNDIYVIVTDAEGNIFLCSHTLKAEELVGDKMPEELLKAIASADKEYEEKGTLGGLYAKDFFSTAMPIYAEKNGQKSLAGTVVSSISASPMSSFLKEAIEIFLVASILVLIVCFFVVGFFSYSLVKPIRQMSEAIKTFAGGEFSVRVPVTTEDELGQLAVSINDMANSLSNSEGMRRSFIANISHELKTPMTTIAGFIDGILDGTIEEKDRDRYLKIVSQEVKRLSRLVKSMLDLSRIDSGEMHITPHYFDITNTIFTALLTFEKPIDEKRIEIKGLENAIGQEIYGDQDLLHQVVYNLIENAVKFTNEGGYISFAITDSIDRTVISIENSGTGIEPQELPMIFDRFYKTDKSRSRDKNGMGLGLYIVKTIIQLHGGEIWVSSKMNEFCRFEFYIPKRKPENSQKMDSTGKIRSIKSDNEEITIYDADIIEDSTQEEENDGR